MKLISIEVGNLILAIFGDVNGDFWIGFETIREMSALLNNTLIRIQGERFNGGRRYIIAKI